MPSKEALDEICVDCDAHYCTCRMILDKMGRSSVDSDCSRCHDISYVCPNKQALSETKLSDRALIQMKEIEEHKWIESQRTGYDIGWEKAAMGWITKYASAFSGLFSQGMRNPKEIYRQAETVAGMSNFAVAA